MTMEGAGGSGEPTVIGNGTELCEVPLDDNPPPLPDEMTTPRPDKSFNLADPLESTWRKTNNIKGVIEPIPIKFDDATSTRRPGTPSEFVFLSDRKNVPTEMKNLEERTIQRRRDYLARIRDLERHSAKLLSKYAEERMNLDLATSDTFDRTVVHPLIVVLENLALTRESSSDRSIKIPALDRRIGQLDAKMTRHLHVTINDAKITQLYSIADDLERNLKSEISAENNTSNKIQGGIVQRFESVAGTAMKNIHEEGASRRSGIAVLQHKIESFTPKRFEREEKILGHIASLRAQLSELRAQRIASDKEIYDEILRVTSSLKRAMIVIASDGDSTR